MTEGRLWALAGLTVIAGVGLWVGIAFGAPAGTPPPAVTLSYVTDVDASDAITVDDDAWQVTTDLGFEVTVHSYVVQTWSAVVGACAGDEDARGLALADLVTVDTAAASHSAAPDPAQATGPAAQDMTAGAEPVTMGEGTISADALCTAHVAVAGGEGSGDGRTEPTIEVTGSYVAPGTTEPVAFTVTSDQAWGGVFDLGEIELDDESVSVVVMRDLGTLFDGVDLAAADEEERALSLLRSLSTATRIEVDATI